MAARTSTIEANGRDKEDQNVKKSALFDDKTSLSLGTLAAVSTWLRFPRSMSFVIGT